MMSSLPKIVGLPGERHHSHGKNLPRWMENCFLSTSKSIAAILKLIISTTTALTPHEKIDVRKALEKS